MIICGKVNKVFSEQDSGFRTASLSVITEGYKLTYPDGRKINENDIIGIMGNEIPDVGAEIKVDGSFKKLDKNFQPTFVVSKIISKEGKVDIKALLTSIKGIGPATAEKIYGKLGDDSIEKIIKDPAELEALGLSRFQDAIEASFSKKLDPEDFKKMVQLGFNNKQISIMIRLSKENLYQEFRTNPYKFIVSQDITFRMIDSIALRTLGFNQNSTERLEGAIETVLKGLETSGSTYFDVDDIAETFYSLSGLKDRNLIEQKINEMIVSKKLWFRKNSQTGEVFVGLMSSLEKEKRIARELVRMSRHKTDINVEHYIKERERSTGFALAESQKEAVRAAINHQVFILRGGPGTGKSATSSTIK